MTSAAAPSEQPSPSRVRWILGWVVAPLTVISLLFAGGVHVGARRPDKPLARLMLWAFGGEPGVAGAPPVGERAAEGAWIVGDFEVVIAAPPDLRLELFKREFGVSLLINREDDGAKLYSRLEVDDACDGTCEYAEIESRLADEIPNGEFERMRSSQAVPVARVEWVQRPTKLRSGLRAIGYWWRMQSFDESGALVGDDTTFAWTDPRVDRFLRCSVELAAPYFDRADELIGVCKSLEWRVLEGPRPAIEARFGGRYELGGVTLEVAEPPSGFEFSSYQPGFAVGFRAPEFGDLSALNIISRRVFASEDQREDVIAELTRKPDDERIVQHPLEDLGRDRLFIKEEHGDRMLEGRVAAIRPGADTWLECNFSLWDDQRARADEFKALCLKMLEDV